jgi:hypothetical protein
VTARAEHLQWAKDRALECADRGETAHAVPGRLRECIEGFR